MPMTDLPDDIVDKLKRLAMGYYGRKNGPGGLRDNERDPVHWGTPKTTEQLAKELLEDLGYELDDPKHPTWAETRLDAADRERKRAKGE